MSEEPVLLLTALQHADSLFPSGGFAFSQGIEASLALAHKLGPFDFTGFARAQVRHRWAGADRVALVRAHRLGGDLAGLGDLDREFEASSVSEDLREGSRRNGMALLTGHRRLRTPGAAEYRDQVRRSDAPGHLPVVQGLVWSATGLDERTAMAVAGYQAIASLASAAVRLGVIGAIDAQARIAGLLPDVAAACEDPVDDDQPFESFVPLTEIAIAMNRRSDLRLFSN